MLKCARCGHSWLRRTKEPQQCPQCKSRHWRHPRVKAEQLRNSAKLAEIAPAVGMTQKGN